MPELAGSGFGFSEEEEMVRKEVSAFARKEIAPTAKKRAKLNYMPMEIVKKLGDMGFLGLNLPEKYGGQPASWVILGVVTEELAKVDITAGHMIAHLRGLCIALERASEELQEEWLPPIIRGEKLISLALTEPNCGSDAAAIEARAVRDGDDYILNGEKTCCTYALQSKGAIIFAKTNPAARARGVTCFMVPLDLPGISLSRIEHTGFQPQSAGIISLDDVRVNVRQRIGQDGQGFYLVMEQFDVIRALLGLIAVSAAQTSIDESIAYAKERHIFGKPLAKFEAVSLSIAEHATMLEACRLLCYRTLWLRDKGQRHTKESAMCKWLCPQVAVNAIHRALLIHGHPGYSTDFPLEQRLRDIMGLELADGAAEVMKTIVSRELIGKEFLPY